MPSEASPRLVNDLYFAEHDMDYTIAAIPTEYSGVKFRSRLEARWARFFDLCGWKWEYEPIDLKGWIPDFRLTLPDDSGTELYVEVKPIRSFAECKGTPEYEAIGALRYPYAAIFGINPDFCFWQEELRDGTVWYDSLGERLPHPTYRRRIADNWKAAGNHVQWRRA